MEPFFQELRSYDQLPNKDHKKGEEQKDNNSIGTECSEPRIMDLKFNSSRKYISITVPSKSQAMSPHIKSVDDVVVLGMNLSKFNKPTQFFICVFGVFMFYLIYGYLQELIFSVEGFKPFGWYLTLVQFGFYSIFGLIELQLIQDKRRRIPGKTYMVIAFLTVATMGLSNTSLGYLNYPTQVIFKCCKLIPVMIGGVFIQGFVFLFNRFCVHFIGIDMHWWIKSCNNILLEAVQLVARGPYMTHKELSCSPWAPAWLLVTPISQAAKAAIVSELPLPLLASVFCTHSMEQDEHPVQTYGYAFFFSLTGYFGISFVLALIKIFGALLAVTVTTGRKAMTIVLSFLFFAKPFTFQYVWSGLLVVAGIFLNVYSKNMDKFKLPSIRSLWSRTLEERKTRTLSQTV
ncbi:adenosine 3'-phospho 5'-phosphosulfate transporter 2 isoform X4 [Alligator mississippiensis]|uniref:adenosine 3'-phospho 5'-phosphosulfate transporter 2 isoform X4 n=1 Tax=Alligator mississippiensis TaxID=8496 RepID=UPI0028778DC2|nr:adenosine 3'-phospho 5'-phosphosulfate transporter 2 isoform X4 [Alligator mississippiensis]